MATPRALILDGYNIIHGVPAFAKHLDRSLEAARQALLAACRGLVARRGDLALTVVFDGRGTEGHTRQTHGARLQSLFTAAAEEADAWILNQARTQAAGPELVVVSDDTEVWNNVRAHGARMMSVAQFAGLLEARPASRAGKSGPAGQAAGAKDAPSRGKVRLSPEQERKITEDYRRWLDQGKKYT